ncbi:MAG: flavin monoamine oxidase family protein [Nitrosopumilaceae archaeon]
MMPKKAMVIVILCVAFSFTLSSTFASAEEKVYDVIVIGAGISGLAAADYLDDSGYDVVVLEARDRIGGRLFTDRSWNDIALDIEASWIHGIDKNPITHLAEKYGAETIPFDNEESIVLYDNDGTLVYAYDENHYDEEGNLICNESVDYQRYCNISKRYEKFVKFYQDERENIITSNGKDVSLQVAIDKFVQSENLSGQELEDFLFTVVWYIEGEYGADASDLSLLSFEEMGYKMEGREVIFPDGYDQISDGLAEELGVDKILLEHVVNKIDYNEQIVSVSTSKGTFEAKYVISTLPLGVLKNGDVEFSPALPTSKLEAIENLEMGILNKVYFIFPEVFWDDEYDWVVRIPEEKGHWVYFANLHHVTDQPILLAFNSGKYGLEIEDKPDEEIVAEGTSILRKIYEKDDKIVPEPLYTKVTKWGSSEFTRGAYSYTGVGSTNDEFYELSKPVMNKVFFAGEATEVKYPATVHGAYFSGIREANRIQSFDVILSPTKQMKNWVLPEYVVCKEGLELILNVHDGSAACVSESTKDALVDRGWGKENLY